MVSADRPVLVAMCVVFLLHAKKVSQRTKRIPFPNRLGRSIVCQYFMWTDGIIILPLLDIIIIIIVQSTIITSGG